MDDAVRHILTHHVMCREQFCLTNQTCSYILLKKCTPLCQYILRNYEPRQFFFETTETNILERPIQSLSICLFILCWLDSHFTFFIDIRILPVNQWFKIQYNIFILISKFDVMIYNTSTKHGCLDPALDPHRFLSSPLILSDSHSQRIYFVFSQDLF